MRVNPNVGRFTRPLPAAPEGGERQSQNIQFQFLLFSTPNSPKVASKIKTCKLLVDIVSKYKGKINIYKKNLNSQNLKVYYRGSANVYFSF